MGVLATEQTCWVFCSTLESLRVILSVWTSLHIIGLSVWLFVSRLCFVAYHISPLCLEGYNYTAHNLTALKRRVDLNVARACVGLRAPILRQNSLSITVVKHSVASIPQIWITQLKSSATSLQFWALVFSFPLYFGLLSPLGKNLVKGVD